MLYPYIPADLVVLTMLSAGIWAIGAKEPKPVLGLALLLASLILCAVGVR